MKGWHFEIADDIGIDVEDIDSYPKSVIDVLIEKRKYDAYIEEKEEKIK